MHWFSFSLRLQILREILSVFAFPLCSLLHTLHSGFCPPQKLLLSKLPPLRTPHSATPPRRCQINKSQSFSYWPVVTSHSSHPFLLETSSSPGLQLPPSPWPLLVHLLCQILPAKCGHSPEVSSQPSSLTVLPSMEGFSSPKGLNRTLCGHAPNFCL